MLELDRSAITPLDELKAEALEKVIDQNVVFVVDPTPDLNGMLRWVLAFHGPEGPTCLGKTTRAASLVTEFSALFDELDRIGALHQLSNERRKEMTAEVWAGAQLAMQEVNRRKAL